MEDIGCGNWYRIVEVQRRENSSCLIMLFMKILAKGKKKYYLEAPGRGILGELHQNPLALCPSLVNIGLR